MKPLDRLLAAAGVVVLWLGSLAAAAAETDYLVVVRGQGSGSTAVDDRIAASGGMVKERWEDLGLVLASSANPGFRAAVAADPRVFGVAADVELPWLPEVHARRAVLEPVAAGVNSEPLASHQWNLLQIGAHFAAAQGQLGAGALVAVLDGGFWTAHPDLAPNFDIELSRSFVPGEPGIEPANPGFSHGTHVAGIVAAPVNGIGIQGVAPQARIVGVKVLRSADGSGAFSWIIQGILYATSIEADVINLSLGATFDRIKKGGEVLGPLIAALNRAVNHAALSGSLVVCAAGNEHADLDSQLWAIPAQSGVALAVSATAPVGRRDFDTPAPYTNYGLSVIDVAAPGGNLASGLPEDGILAPAGWSSDGWQYYYAAGTSMAAPHVSGLAALLVGRFGKMPPAQLRSMIERSADDILKPGADAYSGRGRINAVSALVLE